MASPPPGVTIDQPPPAGVTVDQKPPPGVTADQPGTKPLPGAEEGAAAFEQGALFDPLEKIGQMLEHVPFFGIGPEARAEGALLMRDLPAGIKRHIAESQAAGERNPGTRLLGNIAPALGLRGGTQVADVLTGGGFGVTQPLDPNDPNYWRDVGLQGLFGSVLSWGLGRFGRHIADQQAAVKTAEDAYKKQLADAAKSHIAALGEHGLAQREALEADAARATEHAKQTGYAFGDYLDSIARQHRGITSHLDTLAMQAEDAAKAQRQHASNAEEYVREHARLQAEHNRGLAEHAARVADRNALDERETIAWQRRAGEAAGLRPRDIPQTTGTVELEQLHNKISDKLNAANSRLSFDPDATDAIHAIESIRDRIRFNNTGMEAEWRGLIDNKVLNTIAEEPPPPRGYTVGPQAPQARWVAKAPLQGQEYAQYVTMMNAEADRLYKASRFPGNNNASDQLAMSQALHDIVNMVEDGATGTPEAKAQRDAAREGYRIWSTLRHAADPKDLSVAKSGAIMDEVERRAGGPDKFGKQLAEGHPDAVHAEAWRRQALAPEPTPPPKPQFPAAPERPTVRVPSERVPAGLTKEFGEPKLPKPPEPSKAATAPPPERPPDPTPPKPPPETAARKAARAGTYGVGHAAAFEIARRLGLPIGAGNVLLEAARLAASGKGGGKASRAAQEAVKALGGRPGLGGVAGGQAAGRKPRRASYNDILNQIVPGGPGG